MYLLSSIESEVKVRKVKTVRGEGGRWRIMVGRGRAGAMEDRGSREGEGGRH